MIDEKDIIQQEEIDLRRVVQRFIQGWPIVLASLLVWIILGVVFLFSFPAWYTAKTTLLIEKPLGAHDPATMVTRTQNFIKTDDFYYSNQKVAVRSYPLVRQAVEATGMQVSYLKKGILFDKELYSNRPLSVELDTTHMGMERNRTPYGTKFYVRVKNNHTFDIEAEGEYPVTKKPIQFSGTFPFGEWVTMDQTRFRVFLNDTIAQPNITSQHDLKAETFGFVIKDLNAVTLEYINNMAIAAEDVEATIIGISLTGSVPDKQRDFLHNLTISFITDQMRVKTKALDRAIAYLTSELEGLRNELLFSEKQIQAFKTENSITNLYREGTILVEEAMKMENDRVGHMVKKKYYDYLVDFLRKEDDYTGLISPQAFGIDDKLLGSLTEDLVKLEFERNAIAASGNTNNPIYQQIVNKIENNKQIILSTVKGFQESNQIMLDNLDNRLGSLDESARDLPRVQQELLNMERMYRINEALYSSLMDKKAEAEITRISASPDVRIIEPAYITSVEPQFPKTGIVLAASLLLGLFTGMVWLIGRSAFNSKLQSPADLRKYLYRIPPVGKVHHSNITTPKELAAYPESRTSEELGSIVYVLQQKFRGSGRSYALCSYGSGEGKSTLTALLGTKTGQLGYKTLCMDLNLRDPRLQDFFDAPNSKGLTEYLRGAADIEDIIKPSGVEHVDLITAGHRKTGYHIDEPRMDALLKTLAKTYDFIFIDTAPFARVTETIQIMDHVTHSLIVTRRKKTRYSDLEKTNELAMNGVIKNASVIATDVFEEEVRFILFPNKREKYFKNKKVGFAEQVNRWMLRV